MSGDTTAHERLVAALKASRAGTWRWDIRTDVVDWDEALCAVYGLPHEQAPRSSGAFLQLIHPEDRERAGRLLGRSSNGAARSSTSFAPWSAIASSGSTIAAP